MRTTHDAIAVEPIITSGWVAVFVALGFLLLACDAVIAAVAFHDLSAGGALVVTGTLTAVFVGVGVMVTAFVVKYRV